MRCQTELAGNVVCNLEESDSNACTLCLNHLKGAEKCYHHTQRGMQNIWFNQDSVGNNQNCSWLGSKTDRQSGRREVGTSLLGQKVGNEAGFFIACKTF